tara:strand:+ start:240 stop:476 length:237 start_codon:yes stop_codon:yes gene_type:complete
MRLLESRPHQSHFSGHEPKSQRTHILNEERSYAEDRNPFYVTGICGVNFRAYNKDDAPELNEDNFSRVNCKRCLNKIK